SDFLSAPLVSDSGSVFFQNRFGDLESFDATTLEFQREYTFPSPVYATAVGNGVVAVAATSTNQLFMVDEVTGNEISRWSPTNGELLSGEIILTNSHVFAIQWPGTYSLATIHAINIRTGQSEWSAQFLPQIGYMALG